MLHARNNVSPARYCRVTYLALAGGLPSGAQNKPNAAGSAVFKTQSEAVVLLPSKQLEWKEAQEVRNGVDIRNVTGEVLCLIFTIYLPSKRRIF